MGWCCSGGCVWWYLWIFVSVGLLDVADAYEYQQRIKHEHETANSQGLFPNVFNLAASSVITVNATCGESAPEVYCKLVEHVYIGEHESYRRNRDNQEQCNTCDAKSLDKKHPVENAIDGTNQWWQSPTLQNGKQYEWVTITLDLKQMYQIAYVIVKAAISPRPGNWILERSLDGIIYKPWQYYALTDSECWDSYGIRPTVGKPHYRTDDEVICTSYYSKLNPLENGEIHTSLLNGRPGVDGPTIKLMEFTKARYVRLRLQKIRTLNADLMTIRSGDSENIDKLVTRRYFYSIKDISVGGQCACSGHASTCVSDSVTGKLQCECKHHTCGDNCDHCCPLYNQKKWNHGTSSSAEICERCECYGHSDACHYEQVVADKKLSVNIHGKYIGGGVCDNCKHHTSGINCEQCEDGYFRPSNVLRNHSRPCRKCQCSGPGMTGLCVKDDSHLLEGLEPGDCFCKTGFSGKNCDTCDIGYRNYPQCSPCPCHTAGTSGGSICEGECICKTYVEGSRCDRCKSGFYHLSADNPDGCSQCFCFGMSDECTEADWGVTIIQNIEDWRITDLAGTQVIKPFLEHGNVVIANDEVSKFSSYYWLAPPDYLGKKLYSYGSDLKFTLSYVVARGDTSGTYTENADVVLEGNGLQIGFNWGVRSEDEEVAISVALREQGWFLLTPREDGTTSVSREDFTLVLNNLTKLLVRAKFHTDQIEGRLHNIGMEIAAKDSKSLRKIGSVEKCICPVGYAGLSCELCATGYRSRTGPKIGHICERCDCYNHAKSCDNPSSRCENCMHHTTGLKCERCVRGYYGNATIGTPDDCKPCACPLENPENNFSSSCTAIQNSSGDSDYVCDLCSEGYDGNKCERCSDGYFGNPQVLGGYCQKCDCNGNADTSVSGWCDSLTGQCLKCLGNTAGWNCGDCLPEHYGNPVLRNCQPCSCNSLGSLSSQCDMTTGQCRCKTGVIGRTCNRCADGYGYLEVGCKPCKCNPTGSRTEICDPVTGYCSCKPGVFGITCDSCLDGYFGFSRQGCQECRCNRQGSLSVHCNENNGQCACKSHVVGRMCDKCEDGYWNLQSGNGCEQCHCNRTGSLVSVCNPNTGQCNCKPGVGGQFCDQCLSGYYKFTRQGCRRCDQCDRPGHICDPTNGRCVCPPFTTGSRCQRCVRNAWGYDPLNGCKPCDCNRQGSPQQNCDPTTGNCICLEGFEGRHCDQCRHGFYNFPNCHKCDCRFEGTIKNQCRDNVCQCNSRGDCPCKELVTGQKCEKCAEGAFGLSSEVVKGCFECSCFGKSHICNQASMYWTKIQFPSRDIYMEIGRPDIQTRLGFQIFPENESVKRLSIPYVLDRPLYWSLSKEKLGDKVSSYNGYLTFNIDVRGSSVFPDKLLESYPLIVLQGNQRIILVHSQLKVPSHMPYKVHLHEDAWKIYDNPLMPVTKTILMVALQNVDHLLIRGTNGPEVKYARLHNVTLDEASTGYSQPLAIGVEVCRCPREYVGTSCQDPASGYYRKKKPNYLNSKDVLDLIGWAEPCACNNHTNTCDKETGICINCGGNTMGDHCDQCKKGYYGDPTRGPCRPCACPHPTNSFSDTCVPDAVDYVCINCQEGYSGRHCEKCEAGYYGDLTRIDGKCIPCNCNPYGSKKRDCDSRTGQCQCNEGVSGQDCTICSHGYILTEYGCKSCDDECTGILLKELFEMKLNIDNLNVTDLPRLPWGYLNQILAEKQRLRPLVDEYQKNISMGKDLVDQFTFYLDLEAKADTLLVKARDYIKRATTVSGDAEDTHIEAEKLLAKIRKIFDEIRALVKELEADDSDPTGPSISVERMLAEAERILREIKSRNFSPDKEEAERELRKAQNLLNSVKKFTLDRAHVDELKQRLDVLENLLADLISKIDEKVRKPVERSIEMYQSGVARKGEVEAIVGEINGFLDSSNKTLNEADDLLNLANNALIDASVKFEYLPRYLRDLSNATHRLDEHRSILAHLNPIYKEKYVIPAQNHADELEKQMQHLANHFQATKELSDIPLKAAAAYQNIIDAIVAAEFAAQEAERAADIAYRQAYPDIGDSLSERSDDARARSLELLAEAQKLNDEKVPELEGIMHARRKELEDLSEDLAFGKRNNDLINRELDALPKNIHGVIENAANKARIAEGKAKGANARADDLINRLNDDLYPKLISIQTGTREGTENLTRIIQQARDDIRTASRIAQNADATAKRVKKQHDITELSLKELKDKILLARQKASSIKIGLTSDRSGKCVRSYAPHIEPSTTNNIILNFATKTRKNSLLFFIGSAEVEDFMAIEMVNMKIRFLWNVGGGTETITHEKEIEINNEQFLKNSQWFKIEANRIGNIGTLSVKRTPDGQKPDPYEVSGVSPAGFTKMDLNSSSALFIGGFPSGYLGPGELKITSFSGCLYEVLLDGKPVGLWNFLTNEGCDGCKEGATEDVDFSAFEFQGGDSYAVLPQIPYYKKNDLYAVLSFKTLNEDALLFLSCNPSKGHLMSLELKAGKVIYHLKMDSNVHIRLETKKKYNTGKWVRVEAGRERFEAQMLVENEFLEENSIRGTSSALDLKVSSLYYGGVPPNFTIERWPELIFTNFFGCMKDIQLDSTPIDLSRGSFYGMNVGCSDRPLKVATFKSSGYLEMNGQRIRGNTSISFSFMTNQNDAILLLSTYVGQDTTDQDLLQSYYSVSLKDGWIVAMFTSAGTKIKMVSNRVINHGVFHTVNIIKENRRLILRLDDEHETDVWLVKKVKGIESPSKGGLFFGGVKKNINIGSMAASEEPFIGIIQDAVFNDRLLRFEDTVSHKSVEFGRPNIKKSSEYHVFQQMAPSAPDENCPLNFHLENEAVNLQSSKDIEMSLNKKDIVNNFNISLGYRTYYTDGKIISLSNERKKLQLSVYLQNGVVKAHLSKKKQHKNKSSKELAIGKWYKIELIKKGKRLIIFLDNRHSISMSVPKRVPFKKLLIGGVVNVTDTYSEVNIQNNFKGCIKNLHVNGKRKKISSVNPCFKHVDFGVHFTGIGHIKQNNAFYLGNKVDLKFKFRTTNFDGSIFSIFSHSTDIWIELCLSDNKIIASFYKQEDMLQLTHTINAGNMCDYNWHFVEFFYTDGDIALKLDDLKPSEQKVKSNVKNLGLAEVYIGGKPDKYKNAGQCKNNFSGCVRGMTLNGDVLQIKSSESEDNIVQFMCPQL